ncbi:hypothetical protein NKR23_g8967 [Pleurostoma richardsiae]|uniref:Uncharacterized protein n=1 Tax=Pleurostoma richardsiae TaxID=41990 RepID=A0AA38RIJ5_9PEZI|nr:hypothetical protein NKR23_g8967 [Pleurostoma richardsiae]
MTLIMAEPTTASTLLKRINDAIEERETNNYDAKVTMALRNMAQVFTDFLVNAPSNQEAQRALVATQLTRRACERRLTQIDAQQSPQGPQESLLRDISQLKAARDGIKRNLAFVRKCESKLDAYRNSIPVEEEGEENTVSKEISQLKAAREDIKQSLAVVRECESRLDAYKASTGVEEEGDDIVWIEKSDCLTTPGETRDTSL